MTRIILENVKCTADLMRLLHEAVRAFNENDLYSTIEQIFPRPEIPIPDAGVRVRELGDRPRQVPLVPCPSRGEHRMLKECWMCWGDVMRGVATEADVLHPDRWDEGLQEVLATRDQG